MAKCSYKGCDKVKTLASVSFFKFPNDQRRPIWLSHAQCDYLSKFSYICELHFYPKDIKIEGTRNRLKGGALPISCSDCSCSDTSIDSSCFQIMNSCTPRQHPSTTATVQKSVNTSSETSEVSNKQNDPHTSTTKPLRTYSHLPAKPSDACVLPIKSPSPSSSSSPKLVFDFNTDSKPKSYSRDKSLTNKPSQMTPIKTSQPKLEHINEGIDKMPKRQKMDTEHVLRKLLENQFEGLPTDAQTFVLAQIFHKPQSHWGPDEKDVCLKLFYKSPSAYYHMLRSGFKLPVVSTIYVWHSALSLPAGFSDHIFSLLNNRAKTMTVMERNCILILDEMPIKPELEYDIDDDLIYGFTDFGELGRTTTIASKAMVLTLRGLTKNWKQTVSYYIGCPKGDDIAQMIKINIGKITECGLNVVATSCVHGSNNVLAYKLLGGSIGKPYFNLRDRKIFLLYDYMDLFRCTWNVLLNHRIIISEDIVDWNVLVKLYEEDSKDIFRIFTRLTKSHVHPNDFEKLSVKLSSQIFTSNVAAGILYGISKNCYKTDEEKKVASSTAIFIQKISNLFDNLNFDSRNSSSEPISETNDIIRLMELETARKWVASWKCTGPYQRPPCISGLFQTLLGIELLWKHLKSPDQAFHLPHLDTGVAENLSLMPRTNGESYETDHSANSLIRNLKQIIFKQLKSMNEGVGLEPFLQEADNKQIKIKIEDNKEFAIESPIEDHIMESNMVSSIKYNNLDEECEANDSDVDMVISKVCSEKLQKAALIFFTAFAAYKLQMKINCGACKQFMIDKTNAFRKQAVLTHLNVFKTWSEFEKLSVPTVEFENTVRKVQAFFEIHFPDNRKEDNLIETLLCQMVYEFEKVTKSIMCPAVGHSQTIIKFILIGLIKFSIKKTNKDMKIRKQDNG